MDCVVSGSSADVASSDRQNRRFGGQGACDTDPLVSARRTARRDSGFLVRESSKLEEGSYLALYGEALNPASSSGKATFSKTVLDERRLKF